ncbi:MAG: hypothetical protein A2Y74_04580 [Actinobacteria bacterium RBG_13_63_9]|nr:MAG: hypothetical protein A2Y74_04580 [Actinobacteria bacterium RBG_13_63_9]
MTDYLFERECRTPHSECYVIESGEDEIGRVDIHYTPSMAYATVCVGEDMTEDDIRELVSEIDERLVLTTDPFREDFVVTVWAGREAAVFSDEDLMGEEDEDVEGEGNGHRGV